ncbi:TP901-1 family phage major tail protein [Pseudaminobacter salicylatoxidans]|uniref:TP901-1 family phage major tail protein n=1 Tax=Pseudaminobacter salicylatoxidans TaxID=93369 RepID=A0A316BMW6_PSESE|nr:phage major tail protein, TP901-1 family [Pseudaminobacter salicylatoxidans]PWJ73829.1 TP901-1 family phage major tail protein [Pseudaminobacter salicylatoxidans]
MAQHPGRLLLIKIKTAPATFANLCGMKTRSFNLSANEVDTTIPDCNNPGGAVQKTAEPGIVNRSFSGSGAFVSGATQAALMTNVRNGTVFDAQVVVPGEGTYEGPWMVSDFEFTGEMEGNMEFSATFSAAGPLSFTAEAVTPVNSLLPSIAGIAEEGSELKAYPGEWTGNPVFTFQWKKDGANISGATTDAYTPVSGDVGSTISVTVTATNSTGSASATSGGTADVVAA